MPQHNHAPAEHQENAEQERSREGKLPTNIVSAGAWAVSSASRWTPLQAIVVAFVAFLVLFIYILISGNYDQKAATIRAQEVSREMLDQRTRDQIEEREKHRLHELKLLELSTKNANDQDKIRRDEDRAWREKGELHMKTAEATLREIASAQKESALAQLKLADAVNALTKKLGPIQ